MENGSTAVPENENKTLRGKNGGFLSALSSFAEKKYSIPLFFALALFCLFISAEIGGYNVFDISGDRNEACTLLYLWDYKAGFTSRLLIGEIVGLFTTQITPSLIYNIAGISVLVSFVLHAFLGAAVLRKSIMKKEYIITLFTLVFLLHSLTSLQNIRIKGCLDTYIYILFLLWLYFFDSYFSVFSAPVLCFVCMLIHYSYIFTFMPAVLALMFYCIFNSEKRSKRIACAVSFGSGCAVTLSSFFYFVLFANDHLKMTSDELYDYMASKYALTPIEEIHVRNLFDGNLFFRVYMDCYLFNKDRSLNQLAGVKEELELIRREVIGYVGTSVYIKYAAVFLPLFAAFAVLWIACMKKARGAKKLPFFVFMCMPVTLIPSNLMSSDVWRWTSAAIICQLCVLFALYKTGDSALMDVINSEKLRKKPVMLICGILAVVYIAFALWFGIELPIAY